MIEQKITPCLWFDVNAEEAMNFYVSAFAGSPAARGESKIVNIKRYPEGVSEGPMKDMGGKVLTGIFKLDGQEFMCLDGGPLFKFTEAVSFQILCADQAEVDYFWGKMSAVPESEKCGWLKDKFGLSWQVIPKRMTELLNDPDEEKSGRALMAMLQMKKIDIEAIEKAFNGVN
jgi:predicted 3-demethylubiquinone-9 3-methyltransferase (glyoxalase superfamily)